MSSEKVYELFVQGIERRAFGAYNPADREDVLDWLARTYKPTDREKLQTLMKAIVEYLDPSKGAPAVKWIKWADYKWADDHREPMEPLPVMVIDEGIIRDREEQMAAAERAGIDTRKDGWLVRYVMQTVASKSQRGIA